MRNRSRAVPIRHVRCRRRVPSCPAQDAACEEPEGDGNDGVRWGGGLRWRHFIRAKCQGLRKAGRNHLLLAKRSSFFEKAAPFFREVHHFHERRIRRVKSCSFFDKACAPARKVENFWKRRTA